MERHLSLLLNLFLFRGSLVLALQKKTLGEQLFGATTRLNIKQGVMGLLYVAVAESAKTQLHHRAVVEDLSGRIQQMNRFLRKDKTISISSSLFKLNL